MVEKAAAIDRRRRAQINNQKEAITRLLEALNGGKPVDRTITLEMSILSQGAAELTAQRDEAREALKALAEAVTSSAITLAGDQTQLSIALSDAQTILKASAG